MTVRLVDLLAGLSRLADLGYGLKAGETLRAGAVAAALARSLGLGDEDVRTSLYTALLQHVGCTAYAHETARFSGDEQAWNIAAERADISGLADVLRTLLPQVAGGRPPLEQARLAFLIVARGRRFGLAYATASCEVGRDAARRLRLREEVQRGVYRVHEWWNGRGAPDGLTGEDIPVGTRVAQVASAAVLFDQMGGPGLAAEVVRQRGGSLLDPTIAAHFADRAENLLAEVAAADPRDLVLASEPPPATTVPGPHLVEVARVFGDVADLKTPYTHGHSSGVAALARDAGRRLGLAHSDVADLEVAGLLHDVGRVAVPNAVWEKEGALTADEWEQVRLHAYHAERILTGSQRLASLVRLVGCHHERCDGSGYHRACTDADLSLAARVLAAADAYQAMTQRRPHRPAHAPEQAERELAADGRAGRLDPDAVSAVLAAAGRDTVVRRELPAGLTPREVEVLGLVADGCSNPQVAKELVISRRTAEQHVQNVYRKIGVSSRAAAALFAMEHGLLAPQDP